VGEPNGTVEEETWGDELLEQLREKEITSKSIEIALCIYYS